MVKRVMVTPAELLPGDVLTLREGKEEVINVYLTQDRTTCFVDTDTGRRLMYKADVTIFALRDYADRLGR